jgi:hypothetical protein
VDVLNRGEVVGQLDDAMPDMWYLEGRFTPADTAAGARFAAAASALEVRATYHDHTLAIRSLLRESADDAGTVFVVLSLTDGRLFGRRVSEREAVQWATANVPE